MEKVGFLPRFLAALIDLVILIVLISVVGVIGGGGVTFLYGGGAGYLVALFLALIPLAYTSLEILKAATAGKMAMKIAIRAVDGAPASQDVLIKRWVIKNSAGLLQLLAAITTFSLIGTLGSLAGLVIFIGCFFVLSETKQALHDRIAGTAVYKV